MAITLAEDKKLYPFILQIGTGGTGGYVVQHIAQLLSTSKTAATYIVADPDVIEEKNLGNQLFLAEEVGFKKADVLADRYAAAYDINISAFSEGYIESADQLRSIMRPEYLMELTLEHQIMPIIIGCVDNNYSRKIMHEVFTGASECIYIDAGNESVEVPQDWQTRPKSEWTDEELDVYQNSGWSGQVVTGIKHNGQKLKPLAEVFPDVLLDDDEVKPSELSCTELTASEPQRLIVNKFAALAISNILTQIVEEQTVTSHITMFHTKKGYMRSTPIEVE